MQISRHWRLNPQRYRLEGYRGSNGEVSLQNRPQSPSVEQSSEALGKGKKEQRLLKERADV